MDRCSGDKGGCDGLETSLVEIKWKALSIAWDSLEPRQAIYHRAPGL